MYLIYSTEQAAWDRSEQEGVRIGLKYQEDGVSTRYVTAPMETTNGTFALDVEDYELTDDELSSVVSSFNQKTITPPWSNE